MNDEQRKLVLEHRTIVLPDEIDDDVFHAIKELELEVAGWQNDTTALKNWIKETLEPYIKDLESRLSDMHEERMKYANEVTRLERNDGVGVMKTENLIALLQGLPTDSEVWFSLPHNHMILREKDLVFDKETNILSIDVSLFLDAIWDFAKKNAAEKG